MSQDGPTNQLTGSHAPQDAPQDALALLRLYIEWGVDEAVGTTPQSRPGATGGPLPAALPTFRPAPAAAPPRQLAEKPASSRFDAAPPPTTMAPGKSLGPLDQAAVTSAREAAASAPDLAALRAALERFDGVALRKTA